MNLENQIIKPMCNINRIDPAIIDLGKFLIGTAMEASLREQPSSTDVLGAATTAYQQGRITKAQYFAVINALDERTTGEQWNRDYLEANAYLNQFRGK